MNKSGNVDRTYYKYMSGFHEVLTLLYWILIRCTQIGWNAFYPYLCEHFKMGSDCSLGFCAYVRWGGVQGRESRDGRGRNVLLYSGGVVHCVGWRLLKRSCQAEAEGRGTFWFSCARYVRYVSWCVVCLGHLQSWSQRRKCAWCVCFLAARCTLWVNINVTLSFTSYM